MDIDGKTAVVTGGASGLGFATALRLTKLGAKVVIVDLPSSAGAEVAAALGDNARFVPGNVIEENEMENAFDVADRFGALQILVHCAGHGGAVRILDREGKPGSQAEFERVVRTNLFGTFNVLRLAAARMAAANDDQADRGVCVLTASIAAYEGQIGQVPYASSKAGIVGMTLVAARDLAQRRIRVCSIAPGVFDTPLLARLPETVRTSLAQAVPHPNKLGNPNNFAMLATHIIENEMLNGETIRLDGAHRMPPK
jgi:NAD(P)-dependent dehydrogenase (short-subunit alcohol dehydrogenase family)